MEPWTIDDRFTTAGLVLLFLTGTALGSFINGVICRIPPRLIALRTAEAWAELGYHEAADQTAMVIPPGIVMPRSRCTHCHTPLPWRHLVPVLSWFLLCGRSHCCARPLPIRFPAVEAGMGFLTLSAGVILGPAPELLAGLLFLGSLLALAVIDLEFRLLPDVIVLPLLWVGIALAALEVTIPLSSAIFGAMIGYLVFASFRWIHMRLAGQEGLGLGDCKLMACIGAWLGPELLVMQSVMATGGAFLFGLVMVLFGRRRGNDRIALGSWLAASAVLSLPFAITP